METEIRIGNRTDALELLDMILRGKKLPKNIKAVLLAIRNAIEREVV